MSPAGAGSYPNENALRDLTGTSGSVAGPSPRDLLLAREGLGLTQSELATAMAMTGAQSRRSREEMLHCAS